MNAAKARLEPRDQFIQTSLHPQIHYQAGNEDMARRLAKAVDNSIDMVERIHDKNFLVAPEIYVCDADCFLRFSTMQRTVPAAHFMDAIFMNEPELHEKERRFNMPAENFLVHELTHLLFYQYAGALAYMRTPAWFREGWAVYVSREAGAEACSPEEAAKYVLANSSFDPSEDGSIFRNRTASSYGLRYPVFYRQAGMFVGYLREVDQAAFQNALHSLFMGNGFQDSFEQAYGRSIASYWPGFKKSIRALTVQNRAP